MSSYTLLIADDEESIRNIIERIAVQLGWEVDQASDGDTALDIMQTRNHQIFVIDVKMPGPSGIELAKKILDYEEAPAILILTGFAEVDHAVKAMKEGVFDYIQKDRISGKDIKRLLIDAANYHENLLRARIAQQEREQAFHDLDASNKQFQAVLELSYDMIFILELRTGQIVDCNMAAYRKLGYSRPEMLTLNISNLDTDFQKSEWKEIKNRYSPENTPLSEKEFCDKSGSTFPVEVSFSYVCLDTGEFITLLARDITERKRIQREIKEAKERAESKSAKLQSVIEGMEEGVILTNQTGEITAVNSWMADLAKIPPEFMISRKLSDVVNELFGLNCREIISDFQNQVYRGRKTVESRIAEFKILLRFQPVYHESWFYGIIVNIIDISKLVSAREQAEEKSQLKSDFLSRITQEIRTPLDSIVSITALLSETDLNAEQQPLVDLVKDCGHSLQSIIKGVDDISRIESGSLEIEKEPLHLKAFLEKVVQQVTPKAARRNIRLSSTVDPSIPTISIAHSDALEYILITLLEDALKLFQSGHITMQVMKKEMSNQNIKLQFKVSEFETIQRNDLSGGMAYMYPDDEIRLSLLQDYIDILDGRIWMESLHQNPLSLCFETTLEIVETNTGG